ncbi:MAG: type II toxin-antitoxin system VapB family antitoxin, partial [Treponema sp.]|nr:type II toxin-antitoxin system VapB family antitoxin [Candidatus Treponema scatequi]
VLNDDLVEKALFLAPSIKTKKDLIDTALREFIEVRQIKKIKDIRGMDLFADDYDYKKVREKR